MAHSRPHPKKYVRRLEARKPCVHGEAGFDLRPHQVIVRPLVTEKGTHAVGKQNAYTFEVHMLADKNQITAAVQELFNVRVEAVRTQVRKGKTVRFRQKEGKQGDWKKAVVTLNKEDKIDFF